jgi:hypothetical protein
MFTQTGCLIGFIAVPAFVPLVTIGTIIGIGGTGVALYGAIKLHPLVPEIAPDPNATYYLAGGVGGMLFGAVLDAPNPSHQESLNPISRDQEIATKLGVDLDDISDYNDNLNQVRTVAIELSNDIRSQLKRTDLGSVSSLKDLGNDVRIDQLARKYGFESGLHFVKSFKDEKISVENLRNSLKQPVSVQPTQKSCCGTLFHSTYNKISRLSRALELLSERFTDHLTHLFSTFGSLCCGWKT